MKRKLIVAIFIRLTKIFVGSLFLARRFSKCERKTYCTTNFMGPRLEGTKRDIGGGPYSPGGKKNRWKPALFMAPEEAKGHAEGTILRLKQGARKHTTTRSK
jgi:hypothetical protein